MIYLGIDPGTSRVGWAAIQVKSSKHAPYRNKVSDAGLKVKSFKSLKLETFKYQNVPAGEFLVLGCGCFELSALSHFSRLLYISEQIKNLIKKYKPDVFSIEKIFFAKNTKTVLAVSEARGVIILEAARAGLKILEFTPLEVKIALTGYGRAEKEQVAKMTQIILNLKEIPSPDDITDALAIALTAAAINKITA